MGWNEPDDWGSYYSHCHECGQLVHASGCDSCSCESCEYEGCDKSGPLDPPDRHEVENKTITLSDGSIVCQRHGYCEFCGDIPKSIGDIKRIDGGKFVCIRCSVENKVDQKTGDIEVKFIDNFRILECDQTDIGRYKEMAEEFKKGVKDLNITVVYASAPRNNTPGNCELKISKSDEDPKK